MCLVVAWAFGVGLIDADTKTGTGHEVEKTTVFTQGMMYAIGGDAAQACFMRHLGQLP